MIVINSIEEGRKQDGNRSIADKIIKRLHDLDKTVENNQGRWAWELLQNAKDSIAEEDNRTVSIQILLNEESVEFRHNGTHFTELDIRGLINQISSKEAEEGLETKKTGRFGTGFLTTHLLSRLIKIQGIVKTQSDGFCNFDFLLDRNGKSMKEFAPKIENAWTGFQESVKKIGTDNNKNEFNTSFCYFLESESQKAIARIGIEEFSKLIPFVLTFIPKIEHVEIADNTRNEHTSFRIDQKSKDGLITTIEKIKNKEKTEILILQAFNERVSIATEIEKIEKGYSVKSIKDIPKIFCDFPLIGTENFHFPAIVNSFFFNPQSERDGIWLKSNTDDLEVKENQELLENAVGLYKILISYVIDQDFYDLYNLIETKLPSTNDSYFDATWYKESVQKPIREFLINARIVELEDESLGKKSIKDLCFPLKSYPETIQSRIWQFVFELFPAYACKKEHLHNWCKVSWDDWETVSYQDLADAVSQQKNISNLSLSLCKEEANTFDWINSLCKFFLEDDNNLSLFEKNEIIPNQNGFFKKKSELFIDQIENEELIDILKLLGEDWGNILLNRKVIFGAYPTKNKRDIADKIAERISKQQNDEYYKLAIIRLSEWFDNYPVQGKELFSELYSNRAELFMNTIEDKEILYKVMRCGANLTEISVIAESLAENPKLIQNILELDSLLIDLKVNEVSELRLILESARNSTLINYPIAITVETLLSLGVTSVEELDEALKDAHISAQFIHTSTPTKEMFEYVQELISRSKKNVIDHLKNHTHYDCSDWEELATTVIGGIKKQGLPIHVVVRPSDNGQVIVYYSSEKDTLDYENAELWIDNGKDDPRHFTLGKILKNTGINKIPVY